MPSKTMLIIRIKPGQMESIEEIMASVRQIKSGDVKEVRKEPIGFGVELIRVGVVVSSDETANDLVLAEIGKIKDVEEAEIEGMTLL